MATDFLARALAAAAQGGGGGEPIKPGEVNGGILTTTITGGENPIITPESFAVADKLYIDLSKIQNIDWDHFWELQGGATWDGYVEENVGTYKYKGFSWYDGDETWSYIYYADDDRAEGGRGNCSYYIYSNFTDQPMEYSESWVEGFPSHIPPHSTIFVKEAGEYSYQIYGNNEIGSMDMLVINNADLSRNMWTPELWEYLRPVLSIEPIVPAEKKIEWKTYDYTLNIDNSKLQLQLNDEVISEIDVPQPKPGEINGGILTTVVTKGGEGEYPVITPRDLMKADKLYLNLSKVSEVDWENVYNHGGGQIWIGTEAGETKDFRWTEESSDYLCLEYSSYQYIEDDSIQTTGYVYINLTNEPYDDYDKLDESYPSIPPHGAIVEGWDYSWNEQLSTSFFNSFNANEIAFVNMFASNSPVDDSQVYPEALESLRPLMTVILPTKKEVEWKNEINFQDDNKQIHINTERVKYIESGKEVEKSWTNILTDQYKLKTNAQCKEGNLVDIPVESPSPFKLDHLYINTNYINNIDNISSWFSDEEFSMQMGTLFSVNRYLDFVVMNAIEQLDIDSEKALLFQFWPHEPWNPVVVGLLVNITDDIISLETMDLMPRGMCIVVQDLESRDYVYRPCNGIIDFIEDFRDYYDAFLSEVILGLGDEVLKGDYFELSNEGFLACNKFISVSEPFETTEATKLQLTLNDEVVSEVDMSKGMISYFDEDDNLNITDFNALPRENQ